MVLGFKLNLLSLKGWLGGRIKLASLDLRPMTDEELGKIVEIVSTGISLSFMQKTMNLLSGIEL